MAKTSTAKKSYAKSRRKKTPQLTPAMISGLTLSLVIIFVLSVWLALKIFRTPTAENNPTFANNCPGREQILENLAACSVAIRGNDYRFGSGFVVAPGYVLTNYHVASQIDQPRLTQGEGEISAEISATNQELDLALLKFSPENALPTCILNQNDSLAPLATLYAAGWPYNSNGRVSFMIGNLSRYSENNDHAYLQVDINVMPGNSGGPIANDCGVVGINSFEIQYEDEGSQTIYQGFDLALPTPTFTKWLESLEIDF